MALVHTSCGIEIPQNFFDGPVDMEHIRRFVVRAESLGYSGLWLQERIPHDLAILEPLTLLSYAAALTRHLTLGVSVILLPLRNPFQLAKSLATLDCMSRGRALLGVGLGGGHLGSHEEIFGYSREKRVRRFVESVEILKLLWTEPKRLFTEASGILKIFPWNPSRSKNRTCRCGLAAITKTRFDAFLHGPSLGLPEAE